MAAKNSAAEKKRVKEATRKNCIVKNILDSFAMLPLANGIKLDKIEQLTQTRVIKAELAEIPYVIKEFYTDGTSPSNRPPGFYKHLRHEVEKILKRCEEEALEQQQAINNMDNNQSSSDLPEITVHIRLNPASDEIDIISWISDSIETVLDCNRVDVIGQSLSKLIHPEDHILLYKNLMELKKAMNPETSRNLEPFECRVAPLWRVRAGKNPNYRKVTLRGVIRLWPSQYENLPAESSAVECEIPPAKRQALAAYGSSCPSPSSLPITWARQSPTYIHPEIYAYETFHSIEDMTIISVDRRITSVNCWDPEDVKGISSLKFVETFDLSFAHTVQRLTLDMGLYGDISYALKRKGGGHVFQRSVGVPHTYVMNGQEHHCFKLTTYKISAEEYEENRKKAELLYSEYSPSIDAASFNPEASRAIEYSNMAEPGDIVGYQGCSYSPEYYSDVHPASDSISEISAMRRQSAVDCSDILEGIVNRCL